MDKLFVNFLPPWVETNIQPAFYDKESGSVLQQTARMYAKVQCLVRMFNKLSKETKETVDEYISKFVELKDFVDTYFENLDVQDEVNTKINEMVESGTLQSILGEYINDGYLNDNYYVYPIRKGRLLTKTTANPDYDSSVDFPVMQGGCYVGSNHFIQARLVDSNTNRTQLQEINIETGEVIRTNILQLQHGNSIAYNPTEERLYVTSLTLSGSNTAYVYVLDYTTWNVIKTIDLTSQLEANEGAHSISYDEKNGNLVLGVELKTYNTMRFFYLDEDTEEITEINLTDSYGLLNGRGANNDICVYDNHLYLLKHNPNTISEWDLNTGKLIKVYNIPLITPEGWTQGEGESISYSPTEKLFYFGAYSPDCNGGYIGLNSYYIIDMIHNAPLNKRFSVIGDIVKTVNVDTDSTAWNPDGSNTNKFTTIGEATQLLNLPEIAGLVVKLANNKTYPYANIYSEKVVTITPADTTTRNTIVNGIAVEDSNNVYITALIISGIGSHDFDIRLRRSNVEITGVRFGENHTTHIDTWHSKIRIYNVANDTGITGALFKCQAENEVICLDANPKFEVIGNMPSINKPVECCTVLSSVGNTNVEETMINPVMVSKCSTMSIRAYADYCYQTVEFITQTTDGGNRNFSFVISKYLVKCQLVYDYTNSKFKFRISKAVDLTDSSDVTSSLTLSYVSIFVTH